MSSQHPRPRPSEMVTRRPRAVGVAHALWTAAAVLGVGAALLVLLDLGGMPDALRVIVDRELPGQPDTVRARAADLAVTLLVAVPIVIGVATGIAAAMLRAGRGGARFVLVLLLVLLVAEIVLAFGVVSSAVVGLLAGSAVLGLAAAVAMYRPAASRWFAARR